MKTHHFKLIRDNILQKLDKKGVKYTYSVVSDKKYLHSLLCHKLEEEVLEFLETNSSEELADILEVIENLKAIYPEAERIRKEKLKEAGGFEKGIFLETTEEDE